MAELGQIGAIPIGGMAPSGLFSTGVGHNKNMHNQNYGDEISEHSSDQSD
jgi:hypothetical protein